MDEVQLVLLAQAGDREAFEQLLRGVYPALRRYVAALVGQTEADDVVQETAVQIHRKLGWLREPAYFRAWAFRSASRMAIGRLKRNRRWESLEDHREMAQEIPQSEDFEARLVWNNQIENLASELSAASRAVLLLHYQQEYRLEEIAAVLEIPVGTVKSRLFYAVKTLRKRYAKEEEDEREPIGQEGAGRG
jgi:RNA polymerase sigma-70 factor (ECF subfamily)